MASYGHEKRRMALDRPSNDTVSAHKSKAVTAIPVQEKGRADVDEQARHLVQRMQNQGVAESQDCHHERSSGHPKAHSKQAWTAGKD